MNQIPYFPQQRYARPIAPTPPNYIRPEPTHIPPRPHVPTGLTPIQPAPGLVSVMIPQQYLQHLARPLAMIQAQHAGQMGIAAQSIPAAPMLFPTPTQPQAISVRQQHTSLSDRSNMRSSLNVDPMVPLSDDSAQANHIPSRNSSSTRAPNDGFDANSQVWYQQLIDTNEELIKAVVENMCIERLEDCVQHHKLLQANLVKLAQRVDAIPHQTTDPYFPLQEMEDMLNSVELLQQLEDHIHNRVDVDESEGPRIDTILRLMQQESTNNQSLAQQTACPECVLQNIPATVCRLQLQHVAETQSADGQALEGDGALAFQAANVSTRLVLPPDQLGFTSLPTSAKQSQQKRKYNKWSADEEERMLKALELYCHTDWKQISEFVGTRSRGQCRSRYRTLKGRIAGAENESHPNTGGSSATNLHSEQDDGSKAEETEQQLFFDDHSALDASASNYTQF